VGVEALKTYRTEWDDLNRVFRKQPLHSWESHYADAARYFAVGTQGKTNDWSPIDYSRYDRAVI
jgi:phage terminase large subunit